MHTTPFETEHNLGNYNEDFDNKVPMEVGKAVSLIVGGVWKHTHTKQLRDHDLGKYGFAPHTVSVKLFFNSANEPAMALYSQYKPTHNCPDEPDYVSAAFTVNLVCAHNMVHVINISNCYNEEICTECGFSRRVDSSD